MFVEHTDTHTGLMFESERQQQTAAQMTKEQYFRELQEQIRQKQQRKQGLFSLIFVCKNKTTFDIGLFKQKYAHRLFSNVPRKTS